MKAIIEKVLECLMAYLPFLSKRGKKKMEKMKKFSELVREQYAFLVGQLEKVLQDYFGLSTRVKEMHTEIFSLKTKLVKELQVDRLAGADFFILSGRRLLLHRSILYVLNERSIFAS